MMSSRPLVARYLGYTRGTENHGDEALMGIVCELLAPEIEVVFDPCDADLALIGGGTLINQSPWLIDLATQAFARARHAAVLGSGVGDPRFWGDHFAAWRPLLDRCCVVGVRGPRSLALLRDHGVAHARETGDPYLCLRPPHLALDRLPKRLGVNLGSTNDALFGTTDAETFDFVEAVLRSLAARGWTFDFVSVWSKDLPLLASLRDRTAPGARLFDVRAQPLEAYAALARCEVFMGEKLHANAMAAVAGVPFVALEYQPKVRDFAQSLAMDDWCISTAERDATRLALLVEDLAERRDAVAATMMDHVVTLRRRLHDAVETIKRTIRLEAPCA